ncbi:MAG: endonuclease domain protein [Actinomycetia bacterium]|nr:endonuclease domain protein [Actinomycetes bacterium]
MWSAVQLQTAPTGELVEAAVAVLAEVVGRPVPESPLVCLEQAERLGLGLDLGEAALAARVAVVDRAGQASAHRYPGTKGWLRIALGMRTGRAGERLTVSRQLERLPKTAELLRTKRLPYGYAATIAEAVVRLNDDDCAKAEKILLELAGKGVSATKVAKVGARITEVIAERDGTEQPPEDARRGDRSWWKLSKSLNGTSYVKGRFGPELTALVLDILGPLTKPAGPEDDRDPAERLADALAMHLSGGSTRWNATMVITLDDQADNGNPSDGRQEGRFQADGQPQHATRHGEASTTDDGAHERAQTSRKQQAAYPETDHDPTAHPDGTPHRQAAEVQGLQDQPTQDQPTQKQHSQDQSTQDRTAQGQSTRDQAAEDQNTQDQSTRQSGPIVRRPVWPLEHAKVSAHLADGTPISPERARVIALNAGVSPLILGTDGIPLYLGNRARFVSAGQRRVLEALYETCAFAECDIPARFCEADHTLGWTEHKLTDINLLAPCCSWHNRAKYRYADKISMTRDNRGRWIYTFNRTWKSRHSGTGRQPRGP